MDTAGIRRRTLNPCFNRSEQPGSRATFMRLREDSSLSCPFSPVSDPYALVEGGALVFTPTNNRFATTARATRDTDGVFVYGGGVEHPLLTSHLLARLEYRGLVYHAPDFGLSGLNTSAVTHTAQPSLWVSPSISNARVFLGLALIQPDEIEPEGTLKHRIGCVDSAR